MAETAVSQLPVYSSRPTIRIDEQDFERAGSLLIGMNMPFDVDLLFQIS